MIDSLRLGLLGLLSGQVLAQSTGVITEDSYFYGQSPPSYPSPNATGTGAWADAYTKAKALVSQLTLEEKVCRIFLKLSNHCLALLEEPQGRYESTFTRQSH